MAEYLDLTYAYPTVSKRESHIPPPPPPPTQSFLTILRRLPLWPYNWPINGVGVLRSFGCPKRDKRRGEIGLRTGNISRDFLGRPQFQTSNPKDFCLRLFPLYLLFSSLCEMTITHSSSGKKKRQQKIPQKRGRKKKRVRPTYLIAATFFFCPVRPFVLPTFTHRGMIQSQSFFCCPEAGREERRGGIRFPLDFLH